MPNQTLPYATPTQTPDRPWIPVQILAIAFLFGTGAAGTIAGLNFARLGKKSYLVPCVAVGFVVFIAQMLVILFVLPEGAQRPVGMLTNLAVGAGFMLAQKGDFDAWKASHWQPAAPGEKYKPNKIGLLFLAGLGCLVVEFAIIFGMMLAGGML